MIVALNARTLPDMSGDQVVLAERQPAAVRGYWTDEELLATAGLSSLPMLRKLQAQGWVAAGHLPIPGGGRRRAWVLRDVICVGVVAEVARRTDLAVLAVALLLQRLPYDWFEEAVRLEQRIEWARTGGDEEVSSRETPSRIVILDLSEAWFEREAGDFELISSDLALSGASLKVAPVRDAQRPRRPAEALIGSSAATSIIDLAKLSLGFVGVVAEVRAMPTALTTRP